MQGVQARIDIPPAMSGMQLSEWACRPAFEFLPAAPPPAAAAASVAPSPAAVAPWATASCAGQMSGCEGLGCHPFGRGIARRNATVQGDFGHPICLRHAPDVRTERERGFEGDAAMQRRTIFRNLAGTDRKKAVISRQERLTEPGPAVNTSLTYIRTAMEPFTKSQLKHTRKRSLAEPEEPRAKRRAGNADAATETAVVVVSMHPPLRQLDDGPLWQLPPRAPHADSTGLASR